MENVIQPDLNLNLRTTVVNLKLWLVVIGSILFMSQNQVAAQTYDTGQPGYPEMIPYFEDDGDYIEVHFNIEVDDYEAGTNIDHVNQIYVTWGSEVIYRVEHVGLYNANLVTTHNAGYVYPRWAGPTDLRFWIHQDVQADVQIGGGWANVVGTTPISVNRVHLRILKSALANIQGPNVVTGSVGLGGVFRDKTSGTVADEACGNHFSAPFTVYKLEEDNSGNDEVDFSATLNANEGYVEVKFRGIKFEAEGVADHMANIQLKVQNNSRSVPTKNLVTVGHKNLGCNPVAPVTNFNGAYQPDFKFGGIYPSEVVVSGGPPNYMNYEPDQDGYFSIKHYYDKESMGDDLSYSISGTYYSKDHYSINNITNVDSWAVGNSVTITPNVNYTIPNVTGFNVVSPIASGSCEIVLNWNDYLDIGDPVRNMVGVYRNNVLITELNPNSFITYTDTDVVAGVEYSYQLRALHKRDINGDLEGDMTPAFIGKIEVPKAPSGS
ncbi:MAG: hypothetical protein JKY54_19255 [Flavobacteriales bacterium]|nr:hypothetical protein [Flavobacteriales bacterium]